MSGQGPRGAGASHDMGLHLPPRASTRNKVPLKGASNRMSRRSRGIRGQGDSGRSHSKMPTGTDTVSVTCQPSLSVRVNIHSPAPRSSGSSSPCFLLVRSRRSHGVPRLLYGHGYFSVFLSWIGFDAVKRDGHARRITTEMLAVSLQRAPDGRTAIPPVSPAPTSEYVIEAGSPSACSRLQTPCPPRTR